MKTPNLNLTDFFELDQKEILMVLASQLYEKGNLSLGQAADLAGVSKRYFAERLADYGLSIFNYPFDDLSKDVRNA